ncbi:MAG: FtsX-like permease family protein [Tenericutes bacterium]|nr:FtsX-like permease family protein [Mycoplasmatota bacterium]
MNILNKLTIKNLKLNKKRTIVTIIGIILSVALICAVASMVSSFRESLIRFEINRDGNFHYEFSNVDSKTLKEIKNNRNFEKIYISKNIGYLKLDNSKNEDKPYAYLIAMNKITMSNVSLNLIEGRFPSNDKEIVIPRHLKTNGRIDYKVGDTITLYLGDRVSDGYTLNQNNPYHKDEETFDIKDTKTFKIVGIIERPSTIIENYSAPGYTFITYLNDNNYSGEYNVYLRYTKEALKNRYEITAKLLNVDPIKYKKYMTDLDSLKNSEIDEIEEKIVKTPHIMNGYLISLETMSLKNSTMKVLYILSTIVIIIIIVSSVFCIKNSFDISIAEKTKQYGMFRSIGATSKQIKKNVLYEAFILGIIGIPLGILCGLLASWILIKVCNYYLYGTLNGITLVFNTSLISILISILLGSITIYFSALKSARRASKLSPMVAIRNSEDIKIKSKKLRTPKYIKSLFGVGGVISYKNLKRNKKKYRTTVISIVISVSVFIGLYYFMNMAFSILDLEVGSSDANIQLIIGDNSKDKENNLNKIEQIFNLDNIERISFQKRLLGEIIDKTLYTKEFNKLIGTNGTKISIFAIGDSEYRTYVKSLGLNYSDVKNTGILINNSFAYDEDSKKDVEISVLNIKKNDKVDIKINNITHQIKISEVTKERPFGFSNTYSSGFIIVSDEYLKELDSNFNYGWILIRSNNADLLQSNIEKILGDIDYNLDNTDKNYRIVKGVYTLVAIFLYGFITVITLIGITNIFNTITTNINLRRGEFAILKSVGMTSHEFNRLINLETIFYSLKSLLIGIPLGVGISYLIYIAFSEGSREFQYEFPFGGVFISILAVFILVFIIMNYSIKKVNKQNIIEDIRNENI